jgi:hypothetical protein
MTELLHIYTYNCYPATMTFQSLKTANVMPARGRSIQPLNYDNELTNAL